MEATTPHLTLLLAEAELELVPESVKEHPAVRASASRAGKRARRTLLDSSLHHAALRHLPEGERRGRPDIAHVFLLTAQDSILNKRGGLSALVHTRNDELIRIAPETRIMRNYNRFVGLMENVLREGRAPREGTALLELERDVPLARAVATVGADAVILFDEAGKRQRLDALFAGLDAKTRHVACVLGGFPNGGFRSTLDFSHERIALHDEPLSAWVVASEAIVNWENHAYPS